MTRGIYNHEMDDADFTWLIQSFQEQNPEYRLIQSQGNPVVMLWIPSPVESEEEVPQGPVAMLAGGESEEHSDVDSLE